MRKYYAIYKCQLCGQLMQYDKPHEVPYDKLPDLCVRVIANQQFFGNPHLYQSPMQVPHKCKDGSCGMAYFAGFRPA